MRKKSGLPDYALLTFALVALAALGHFFLDGNASFHNVRPNPYFVLAICAGAYFGFKVGVMFSIFSALVYLVLLDRQIDYMEVESLFSLEYLLLPVLTIFFGGFIGEISQRNFDQILRLRNDLGRSEKRADSIEEEAANFQKENRELKGRLVSKVDTVNNLLDSFSSLVSTDFDEINYSFLKIVESQIKAKKLAIYYFESEELKLRFQNSEDYELPSTISLDDDRFGLVRRSIELKKTGSYELLNIEMDSRDRVIEGQIFPLVGPIITQDGHIHGVVCIKEIGFLDLVPTNIKLLGLFLRWISSSLDSLTQVNLAIEKSQYDPRTRSLKPKAFDSLLSTLKIALEKRSERFAVINIEMGLDITKTSDKHFDLINQVLLDRSQGELAISYDQGLGKWQILVKGQADKITNQEHQIKAELSHANIPNTVTPRIETVFLNQGNGRV